MDTNLDKFVHDTADIFIECLENGKVPPEAFKRAARVHGMNHDAFMKVLSAANEAKRSTMKFELLYRRAYFPDEPIEDVAAVFGLNEEQVRRFTGEEA